MPQFSKRLVSICSPLADVTIARKDEEKKNIIGCKQQLKKLHKENDMAALEQTGNWPQE